ncbi:MAG: RNA polymerase sigma factor [Gammaproteobacteria bacterium]|jgi:RNA polymerase sigma-70 factor, ECF subfamily|nr:RNA polymerase sigma factor [Gammaproteobacteria bacterium]MBT4495081.1 RNA polymerase sigma factor [Gammaproteobacteria bacterium]MBT7370198.1 RNA polymerase sigma factor [Gammaproteobacteria bacterium]
MTFETEDALIEGMIDGQNDAFRTAISRYQTSMKFLAISLVGEKIADEVVQETWMSALNAIDRFERRSSLKTWLLRIVANEGKTRLRKENRLSSLDALLEADPHFTTRFDSTGHWSPLPFQWDEDSPDDLLTRDELKLCMDELITVLPDLQAATLNLRERQGHSLKEICNILEVSESNVRVLLHRARLRLFRCIEHFQQTGECCTSMENKK